MSQKQRTLASLLGAVVACAALGGLAYKTSQDEEKKATADEKAAHITSFDSAKVDSIKVIAKGQTTELQKTGDAWNIISPIHAPADLGVVDGVLGGLDDLKSKSKVEDNATDLGKYELDKPVADVEAKGPDIDVHVLLGASNGFNGGEYVKRANDGIVYLAEGTGAQLEKTTFDLRDKRVHAFDVKAMTGLAVKSPDGDYSLSGSPDGWKLTAPIEEAADEQVAQQVLTTLSNLRSIGIPEEEPKDLAKYGLDHPTRTATVSSPSLSFTFSFGAPPGKEKEELYARTDLNPAVFRLMTNALDTLKQTPETLEDKSVAKFDADAVKALSISVGGSTILLQRKRGADAGGVEAWSQLSPTSGEGKAWKINSIVRNLANLRAAKVEGKPSDLKPYGLDAPKTTVTVQDNQGAALADLLIGSEKDGNVYVKLKDDPRVFEVEKFKLGSLPQGPRDLLADTLDAG